MKRVNLLAAIFLCYFSSVVFAEIASTGDVSPTNTTTWSPSTIGIIGNTTDGTLNITNGGVISSYIGYIGYSSGSMGSVTVDGVGSTWTSSFTIKVGFRGDGTLNITGGGAVNNDYGVNIGANSDSTGIVTVDGAGSTWTNSDDFTVGREGNGTMNITGGGAVSNHYGFIGHDYESMGEVTVDGAGSTWTNNYGLSVGGDGDATLNITNGGAVSNNKGFLGSWSGSTGVATVNGAGSTWTNNGLLSVGTFGNGTLNITDGGFVSVASTLTIDSNGGDDSFINMATGGMLALYGEADDSLADFLGLISGTGLIRYWNDSVLDWADIVGATYGMDYTLDYITDGELEGYTVLSVPEPCSLVLLGLGGLALRRRRA